MKVINKYSVTMYEFGKNDLSKANIVIASSEREAIEIALKDPWWFKEDSGWGSKLLVYPLTFKAVISNDR